MLTGLPSHGGQCVNSFVVSDTVGVTLVDPGVDVDSALIAQIELDRIDRILITHVHRENVAGVANFPGVPVFVEEGDRYLCDGEVAYRSKLRIWEPPWEWETRGNFEGDLAGALNERPPVDGMQNVQGVQAGDRVGNFDVLSTPGHGKHALTFLATLHGRRIAFAGDAILASGKILNWFDIDWDYGLHGGQIALLKSLHLLRKHLPDLILPTHGDVIETPNADLDSVISVLARIVEAEPIRSPVSPTAASATMVSADWAQLSPHLFQWRNLWGNANLIVSDDGYGLMIDDGLCQWIDLAARKDRHDRAIAEIRKITGVNKIEVIIPTHYHGDHIENIPDLQRIEPEVRVISLDVVADPIEYPTRYNLACPLPWYGTAYDTVRIDSRVTSGDVIRWRGHELEIFHLGGQTYHHAGIDVRIDGRRVLFVGDSISLHDGIDPILTYNDCDPETRGWVYAMDRAIERTPDLIVAGHAVAAINPMPFLLAKREAWRQRISQFQALSPYPSLRAFFDPFTA